MIKSMRMRWARHVARKEEGRVVYRVLVGDQDVDGRITLRCFLGRQR